MESLPELGKQYGRSQSEFVVVFVLTELSFLDSDILSIKVPGTQFIILNSAKVIQDLLVKRSNIYSDR